MKDKSIKQPWPGSARVTVWVLGILLFIASANVWLLCEKVQEYSHAFRVAQSDFPTFGDYVISGGMLNPATKDVDMDWLHRETTKRLLKARHDKGLPRPEFRELPDIGISEMTGLHPTEDPFNYDIPWDEIKEMQDTILAELAKEKTSDSH